MRNPWGSLKALDRAAYLIAAATLVNRAGTMVLPLLVLYLTRERGLDAELAGGMLSLYGGVALCAAPIGGRLCDRVGPVHVMVASLLGSGLVLFALPLLTGPAALACGVGVFALVTEPFRPATLTAMAAVTGPEQRRAGMALNRLAANLGMSLGPALGGVLAEQWFGGVFLVDGLTSLAAGALLVLHFRALARRTRPRGGEDDEARAPSPPVHRDRAFLFFVVAMWLVGVVFLQLDAAMPLFMRDELGLSESSFGLMFTLNTVIIVLFEVPLNAATAGFSHRRMLGIGALACALGFGGLALAHDVWGVAATVVLWTCGEMILFPGSAAYAAESAPPGRAGEYMGAYSMAFSFALVLAPVLGTAALERLGARNAWVAVGMLGVLTALMLARVRAPRRA